MNYNSLRIILPVLSVGLFLGGWSLYVHTSEVSAFVLPPPEAIVRALSVMLFERKLWSHTFVTVVEATSGFGIAVVLGLTLGFVMARVQLVEWAIKPFIVLLQLIPKIALAPLFILWFGFGLESKIVIAAVLSFFPIFSNSLQAFKSIDPEDRDVFIMLQANPIQRFLMLDFPNALPVILTGAEVAVILAMIGAIVGEFIGGNKGLGYLAVAYLQDLAVPELFGVIVVLTLIGLAFYTVIGRLRTLLTPWHVSSTKSRAS
ncbi:MAG: ABC transporter permease [Paracoccaceae bacterium]